MKGSTKAGIAIAAGLSLLASVGAVVVYAKPPSQSTPPPPSAVFYNTLTASNVFVLIGETVTFTAKVEETIGTVTKPLPGIPVTFIEDVFSTEGEATTDASGVATMAVTFKTQGQYMIKAVAKSSLFCPNPSSAPCDLVSGVIQIIVMPKAGIL